MRDLQLVIFDCDGVLVNSEVISNDVLARALSAEGLPTALAEARRDYQGLLLSEVVSQAEAKLGQPLPEGWLAEYERDRTEAFRRDLRPVPGAAEAVQHVIAAGIAVCVASQGKLDKTALSLELTGLASCSRAGRSSQRTTFHAASPILTCSCTQLRRWARSRLAVPSWRTRLPESLRRYRLACGPWAMSPTVMRRPYDRPVLSSWSRWMSCRDCSGSPNSSLHFSCRQTTKVCRCRYRGLCSELVDGAV